MTWNDPEATFEKMGAMMAKNHSKSLGLYDELSTFLTQINLYKSRGISDSHDLALFLHLYNGHPWARRTGLCSGVFACACVVYTHVVCVFVCMSCVPYIATLVLCVQVSLCVTKLCRIAAILRFQVRQISQWRIQV